MTTNSISCRSAADWLAARGIYKVQASALACKFRQDVGQPADADVRRRHGVWQQGDPQSGKCRAELGMRAFDRQPAIRADRLLRRIFGFGS